MLRLRHPAIHVVLSIIAILSIADAQNLGTVTFSPTTQQVYKAATGNLSGHISPDPTSDKISFTVQAWGDVQVVVQSNIPVPFEIVAHYTSNAQGAVPEVVLSTAQQTVFSTNWGWRFRDARVKVHYWLQLTGAVPAGVYTITVTYTLLGANSVTNTIRVTIPPLLSVRVEGGDTVAFDYAGAPQAYYAAIGKTLPPTNAGTTLTSIDVWSSSSYTVAAAITAASPGPSLLPGAVLLKGVPLAASPSVVATGSGTGGAFLPVVVPSDFAFAVTGQETPGSYSEVVTYTVTSP